MNTKKEERESKEPKYVTEEKMRYKPEEVWFPLSESILEWDDDFHTLMLKDHIRMVAYEKAIKEAVKPGMTVIDIGTGTGILALWALEAGADKVYGIEVNKERYNQALERIRAAGYQEKFVLVPGLSTEIPTERLPKADIIISEILGNIADNEGFTTILNDAYRFLKPEGCMLPKEVESFIVPVTSKKAWNAVVKGEIRTLNERYVLSKILEKRGITPFDIYYDTIIPQKKYLSSPKHIQRFVFKGNDAEEYTKTIRFEVESEGEFTGFKGWFVAQLSENTVLDISGDDIAGRKTADCWKHMYAPIKNPVAVKKGDIITLRLSRRKEKNPLEQTYFFEGTVERKGTVISTFKKETRKKQTKEE